jgi:hypothetical protein
MQARQKRSPVFSGGRAVATAEKLQNVESKEEQDRYETVTVTFREF